MAENMSLWTTFLNEIYLPGTEHQLYFLFVSEPGRPADAFKIHLYNFRKNPHFLPGG